MAKKRKAKTALIRVERSRAKIVNDLPLDIHEVIRKSLGYMQTVSYMEADKNGVMRRRLKQVINSKYHYLYRTFPDGMLERCKKVLQNRNYIVKILDKRPQLKVVNTAVVKRMGTFPIYLRPYQIDAVALGVYNPHMIFHVCTGGGKTAIFQAIAHVNDLKTLIIVNRDDLLLQHLSVLSKTMEHDIGVIKGNQVEFDKRICIATVQTVMSQLKRNRYKMNNFLKSIGYVVSDECHHAQSRTWGRVIKLCGNAIYKHGFSGSPWDFASSNMELEAVCGPIKCKVTTSDLIKLGYLAKPTITFHRYRGNEDQVGGDSLPIMYENAIVKNRKRNRAILSVVDHEYRVKEAKMLLVVHRIKHGYILADGLRKMGIHDREIGYLHGQKGRIVRQEGRREFERGDIRIMIVSQIWNEGIDIPSCDVLVKADSYGGGEVYDSEGVRNLIQQIGRVLRKPKKRGAQDVNTKKIHRVRIHDFADKQNKYVEKWTRNRYRTCKMEPEFDVRLK